MADDRSPSETSPGTAQGSAAAPVTGLRPDLMTRLLSGLVLAAVTAELVYLGHIAFAVLIGLIAVVTSWEWSRIVRGEPFDAPLLIHGLTAVAVTVLSATGLVGLGLAAVAIGAILVGLLSFGSHALLSATGVAYVGLPTIALLWLRGDAEHGLAAVVLIILCVVATDVAAYVSGRSFGGPKLAPRLSPNKTWSGLIGGMSASALVAALFAAWYGASPLSIGLSGLFLGFVAQMGDLAESALKRRFGVKDASSLIPGHGGLLDRVDGLVFAAVVAGLVALAIDPTAPARALLFGGL